VKCRSGISRTSMGSERAAKKAWRIEGGNQWRKK
jgi:hypothetical protein